MKCVQKAKNNTIKITTSTKLNMEIVLVLVNHFKGPLKALALLHYAFGLQWHFTY